MTKSAKSITVTRYDYVINHVMDEELQVQGHTHQYSEFDASGRPVKEIKYMQDGSFEEMTVFEYDPAGQLSKQLYYPSEDELAEQVVYHYDESGRVDYARRIYLDGSEDRIDYAYNEGGLLIRKVITNDDQEIDQTEEFEYRDGQLIRHEIFDGEGDRITEPVIDTSSTENSRIERDESGRVILEEELNENDEVIMSVRRSYLPDGEPDEVEVFLDGQGRRISRHYILKYEYTFFD